MKVILTTNIKKLGNIGELVNVKDGFARNYLFPNKMALRNSKSNQEHFEKIKEEIKTKEEEKKQSALELIKKIKNIEINFTKESDEKDQLYGAVSKKEIQKFLEENKITIVSDDIKIIEPIRKLGEHFIEISPYVGLVEKIRVLVKKA